MTLFINFTVLRDEILPVRELSTFHSVQFTPRQLHWISRFSFEKGHIWAQMCPFVKLRFLREYIPKVHDVGI